MTAMTTPRTDVATADSDVRAAFRDSRLFEFAERMSDAVNRSWRASMTRRVVARAASGQAWSFADRVRAVGVCTAVAMATALLLQTVESSLDGPLRWILPSVVGLLGVCIAVAAEPIGRVCRGRRA